MVLLEQSGVNPVVVHGGGPQIGAMLKKLGIASQFSDGLRVTDKATMDIVEMVLAGAINKQIVGFINAEGGRAIDFAARTAAWLRPPSSRVPRARTAIRWTSASSGAGQGGHDGARSGARARTDPVLAPIAQGPGGDTYNINADTFAGAIAGALGAKRLLFLTDVPGVLDKDKKLIEELRVGDIPGLIADGTITGGMIPKVETCMYAIERGVEGVVILDGKLPHAC